MRASSSKCCVVTRGRVGPRVLLVHGFPLDARMWGAQLDALGDMAQLAAIDLPGFGQSAAPSPLPEALTMDTLAHAVLETADTLGWPTFVLGGLSMGGYVVFATLRLARARIGGVLLANTRAGADPPGRLEFRRRDAADVLAQGLGDRPAAQAKNLLSPQTHIDLPDVVTLVKDMVAGSSPATYAAAQRGMALRPDSTDELIAIDVPTLCVTGADDAVMSPDDTRAMADRIPGAELLVVEHAGHLAPLERPEPVNEALRRLLNRI